MNPADFSSIEKQLPATIGYIRERFGPIETDTAIILGSGLGGFAEKMTDSTVISMGEIPGYLHPTVDGHSGKILLGTLESPDHTSHRRILAFQGRIHYYGCGDLTKVLYPIYTMKGLGVEKLLITNAAGGINQHFKPADLMIIRDQINLTFRMPFYADRRSGLDRQRTHGWLYDERINEIIERAAVANGIAVRYGVYAGILGPSYETPAEIRMMQRIGADAVGMSTVLEALQAQILGIRVAGISCITNLASGLQAGKLHHDDVKKTAAIVDETFTRLLRAVLTQADF
jgi:purine-nucleoside phosphorylase